MVVSVGTMMINHIKFGGYPMGQTTGHYVFVSDYIHITTILIFTYYINKQTIHPCVYIYIYTQVHT